MERAHTHNPPGNRAFTLLEVMVAATVMMFGVVGMIQVVVSGSEMLDVARRQTVATQIIHSQIDQYRATIPTSWSSISNGTTTIDLTATSFASVSTGFSCSRTISNVKSDGTLKKVTYTVTWTGNTGQSYSRTGSTYIGKDGLYVAFQRI